MEYSNLFDGYLENYGFMGGGGSSLILDNERGEIVRAPVSTIISSKSDFVNNKAINSEKALIALRNHSDAERRRRERINGHLTTLRNIIPGGTNKMDKASLLAEVIDHLKKLRSNATEATKGLLIPMDIDEVRVEQHDDGSGGDSFLIRASLCCEYKQEVLSDLRQALEALHLKTVRAEIATLGSRMTNLFLITGCEQESIKGSEGYQRFADSVRQALKSVLDKFHASEEFSTNSALSNKRRRVSLFNSSNESSLGVFW